MLDVKYNFSNEELVDAANLFRQDLVAVDESLPSDLQLLDDMACSIQF
tara:strand:- start:210 stop:353 length:144 start_codon:yes stop_codon:yes gene_type:complete